MDFFESGGALAPLPPASDTYDDGYANYSPIYRLCCETKPT